MLINTQLSPIIRRAALDKWKEKLGSSATYDNLMGVFEQAGYQDYADTIKNIDEENDFDACDHGYPTTDNGSISQSMYEGRGDPQALPHECATAGATQAITDETDHCRKRKRKSTVSEGDVSLD